MLVIKLSLRCFLFKNIFISCFGCPDYFQRASVKLHVWDLTEHFSVCLLIVQTGRLPWQKKKENRKVLQKLG